MRENEYLPLGSVVVLKGGIQELMIISRGINVQMNGEVLFFDYGGVLYPDGLLGDQMAYFNNSGIDRVLFVGYDSENSKVIAENIRKYVENTPNLKRGEPTDLNKG